MELATIIAVLISPFLAVFIQDRLNKNSERRERKNKIFRILMATRQQRTSAMHVEALNLIPVDFNGNGNKEENVVNAWKKYIDHLNNYQAELPGQLETNKSLNQQWTNDNNRLFVELLQSMGKLLKYKFTDTEVQNEVYLPRAQSTRDIYESSIISNLAHILAGNTVLPVSVELSENQVAENNIEENVT